MKIHLNHEEPPEQDNWPFGFDPKVDSVNSFTGTVSGILLVFSVFVILISFVIYAFAHSSYPAWCCNGNAETGDCHPVPCETISENDDGSYTWNGITFSPSMVVPNFDKQCHVCINTLTDAQGHAEHHPHCIFLRVTS